MENILLKEIDTVLSKQNKRIHPSSSTGLLDPNFTLPIPKPSMV